MEKGITNSSSNTLQRLKIQKEKLEGHLTRLA